MKPEISYPYNYRKLTDDGRNTVAGQYCNVWHGVFLSLKGVEE